MKILYITHRAHLIDTRSAQNVHVTHVIKGLQEEFETEVLQLRFRHPLFQMLQSFWTIFRAQSKGFDAIYVRHNPSFFLGVAFCRFLPIKCILEMNATVDLERIGWSGGPSLKNSLLCRMERVAVQGADAIIVVTHVLRKHILRWGIPAESVHVIHNGAELAPVPAQKSVQVASRELTIGYLGANHPWHKIEHLASLLELADQRGISLSVRLAGADFSEFAQSLPPHLQERWHSLGPIEHSDVFTFLGSNSVNVLPNTALYCSPIKLFEYLACGVPAAAPDMENIREIIDERTAILFEQDNPADLLDKIVGLYEEAGRATEMGERGRQLVERQFNWEATGRSTCRVLRRLA